MAAEGDNIIRFTYTGADGEWIDDEATHIIVHKDCTVVRARAFYGHDNIVEVICHEDVEKIEEQAFGWCRSLRRVIMRGVVVVGHHAFGGCSALEDVECDKLEIIRQHAFQLCRSLRNINLPSVRIVRRGAFLSCYALTNVNFGNNLEGIEKFAFWDCSSLERITIPLKDGLVTSDDIFMGCENLSQVDLVEGELDETISALQLEEWRSDMNDEINSINHILPHAPAGELRYIIDSNGGDPGEKARTIRRWIRSILHKITDYQAEHQRLLNEAATTLQLVLPNNDIVVKCVLPFLELPPYTFEVGDDDE